MEEKNQRKKIKEKNGKKEKNSPSFCLVIVLFPFVPLRGKKK
jgi:hypothetical protein